MTLEREADLVDGEDLFDGDEVWNRPRRTTRATWILLAALVAVLAFAGGVLVQKGHDATLVTGAARNRAAGAGGFGGGAGGVGGTGGTGGTRTGGQGSGGQAGGGQAGWGQGGSGAQGAGGQAGSGQGGAAGQGGGDQSGGAGQAATGPGGAAPSDAAPVAVGTVKAVSGQTLTLTDFGGTAITVHVPPTATVTTPGLGGVTAGETASVTGTKAADGSVTATAVTVRAAAG